MEEAGELLTKVQNYLLESTVRKKETKNQFIQTCPLETSQ